METFYHLENLDLEKEEFAKLRINVERQLGQGIKRKRKRKRHSQKKTKGLSDEELEIKLEHVTEEVKESIVRKKSAFEIPEKLFTSLNNADYELSEPEISLLSKGPSFCLTPFNVNWRKAVEAFAEWENQIRRKRFFHELKKKEKKQGNEYATQEEEERTWKQEDMIQGVYKVTSLKLPTRGEKIH